MTRIATLLRSTRAATAVEYGLIIALIFLTASVAIGGLGTRTNSMWNNVGTALTSVL